MFVLLGKKNSIISPHLLSSHFLWKLKKQPFAPSINFYSSYISRPFTVLLFIIPLVMQMVKFEIFVEETLLAL